MKVNDDWVSAKSFSKLGKFLESCKYFLRDQRSILNANLLYFDLLFSLHHVLSIYIISQTLIHTNIILECRVVPNKNQKNNVIKF